MLLGERPIVCNLFADDSFPSMVPRNCKGNPRWKHISITDARVLFKPTRKKVLRIVLQYPQKNYVKWGSIRGDEATSASMIKIFYRLISIIFVITLSWSLNVRKIIESWWSSSIQKANFLKNKIIFIRKLNIAPLYIIPYTIRKF